MATGCVQLKNNVTDSFNYIMLFQIRGENNGYVSTNQWVSL